MTPSEILSLDAWPPRRRVRGTAAAACATVGRREHGCAIAGRTYGLLARAAGMAGLGRTAVSLGRVHEGLLLAPRSASAGVEHAAGLSELGRRVLDRRSCRSSLRSQAAHAVIVGTQEALSTRFFRSQGRGRGWRRGPWPRSGVCACASAMSQRSASSKTVGRPFLSCTSALSCSATTMETSWPGAPVQSLACPRIANAPR